MSNLNDDGAIHAEVGGTFIPCPPGNHIAHCFGIIVAGTMMESFQGKPAEPKKKIYIGFEITGKKYLPSDGSAEKPYVIWIEYLQSLSQNANLRKMIESWAGVKYTDKEIETLDIRDLIGKNCLATVVHKTSASGKLRNEIMTIAQLPEGMQCPAMINAPFIFKYKNPFDSVAFDQIPKYIQDKMKETPEYKQALNAGVTQTPTSTTDAPVKKKLF